MLKGALLVSLSGRAQFFDLGAPRFSGTRSPYEDSRTDPPSPAYTGDASLAYIVRGSQTKLRAHLGNSFRAPSLFERFGGSFSPFSGGFNYWGDPRLDPERAIAVDGGIDQWLFGAKWRLSATYFYTNLQKTVIFDFANFPASDIFGRFGGYRNTGGGIARGLEIGTQVSPTSTTNIQATLHLHELGLADPDDRKRLLPDPGPFEACLDDDGHAMDRQALQHHVRHVRSQRLRTVALRYRRPPDAV